MAAGGFSPEELDRARAELVERRRQLWERVERLCSESAQDNPRDLGEISSLPTHPADLGTEAFEQERDFGLAERCSAEIREIDRALLRIDEGGYGICEQCDQRISEERLLALPSAALCARCQSEQEAA
jgi:RNA polymerase-binding transcription factor DksA